VASADVVVTAARPRALAGLGLDPEAVLARDRPRVWVSITGHGGDGPGAHRVGFGDDAAVAGGLVAWDHRSGGPVFCADAVADPATGLAAAAAVLDALAAGGRWLLDVALARVAAHLAGPTVPVPEGVTPSPPRARPVPGPARPLGADTDAVLASLVSREPTPGVALRDT
jgi:crotonobetainyl-CoA:carnitine CoA-transferase CaiB-like acyl-CoA transferase